MPKRFALAVAALLISIAPTFSQTIPSLPDSQKTPGVPLMVIPDDKTASCIADLVGGPLEQGDAITLQMVCAPGYSKCIRNVPAAEKRSVYASYGLQGNHTGYCESQQGCEVDHLISLELGGSNDQKNLWPEPYQGEALNAHVKDRLENFLHTEVCAGRIGLKEAQDEISTNWIESYRKRIGEPPQ